MDNNRAINVPIIIIILAGIFLFIHLYVHYWAQAQSYKHIAKLFLIPEHFSNIPYLSWEGLATALTLISYMFFHGDWSHLLINSFFMLAFGSALAWRFGTLNFILFTIICSIGGGITHLILHWLSPIPVIGASAAIAGQMAGVTRFIFMSEDQIIDYNNRVSQSNRLPSESLLNLLHNGKAMRFIIIFILINIIIGLLPGEQITIAWEAHLGGFLTGLFLFDLFDRRYYS